MTVGRALPLILIASTFVASWLGMQAAHEAGHVLGAFMSGGTVKQVVLYPLTFSRTDLGMNPHPLFVVWAGPALGVLMPLLVWRMAAALRMSGAFVLRFFAGFCLIVNGVYLGVGSFDGAGDCGEMLRHGSQPWQLWLFAAIAAPAGLWLWHRQGKYFGIGRADGSVSPKVTYGTMGAAILLVILGFALHSFQSSH